MRARNNADWRKTFSARSAGENVNWTDAVLTMQVRQHISDASPVLTASTGNGKITTGVSDDPTIGSYFTITILAADVAALSGRYVADLIMVKDGITTPIFSAVIHVDSGVTRL